VQCANVEVQKPVKCANVEVQKPVQCANVQTQQKSSEQKIQQLSVQIRIPMSLKTFGL
jgi:hypothetical protein